MPWGNLLSLVSPKNSLYDCCNHVQHAAGNAKSKDKNANHTANENIDDDDARRICNTAFRWNEPDKHFLYAKWNPNQYPHEDVITATIGCQIQRLAEERCQKGNDDWDCQTFEKFFCHNSPAGWQDASFLLKRAGWSQSSQ